MEENYTNNGAGNDFYENAPKNNFNQDSGNGYNLDEKPTAHDNTDVEIIATIILIIACIGVLIGIIFLIFSFVGVPLWAIFMSKISSLVTFLL